MLLLEFPLFTLSKVVVAGQASSYRVAGARPSRATAFGSLSSDFVISELLPSSYRILMLSWLQRDLSPPSYVCTKQSFGCDLAASNTTKFEALRLRICCWILPEPSQDKVTA